LSVDVDDSNLKIANIEEDINDEESQKSIVEDNLDETNSFVEESSQAFSTSTSTATAGIQLSESQYYLKDNYEKAKRERQLEQEQAEVEKKRLQEILDICMEFQLQEKVKSENSASSSQLAENNAQKSSKSLYTNGIIKNSSTSSSLSSSSNSSHHNNLDENAQSTKLVPPNEQTRK
jgi:hypothetical protein